MIDVLVVGSGIIGSWIAYLAAKHGLSVALCEKMENRGDGISGRNSGVLHSGIYYEQNSAKLQHCLRGYRLSLDFFNQYKIPHTIAGKLITSGEQDNRTKADIRQSIEKLLENGKANGLQNLQWITDPGKEYPGVKGHYAIHVPQTGVVDVPVYLKTLWQLADNAGVIFLKKRKFAFQQNQPLLIDAEKTEPVDSQYIINAAGLYSDEITTQYGLEDYQVRANKGEYYQIRKPLPYHKLIYPMPAVDSTALGVHYTFNMAKEAYAGPNSNWAQSKEDYTIRTPRNVYYQSLCKILDGYQEEDLQPGYAGLRPRLFHRGEAVRDFIIEQQPKHVFHLLGIESPGLTSAPSLAQEIIHQL